MELRIYLQMLARSWWIILLTALAALAIALAAAVFIAPNYTSNGHKLRFFESLKLEG